jgi:hypothetical protein
MLHRGSRSEVWVDAADPAFVFKATADKAYVQYVAWLTDHAPPSPCWPRVTFAEYRPTEKFPWVFRIERLQEMPPYPRGVTADALRRAALDLFNTKAVTLNIFTEDERSAIEVLRRARYAKKLAYSPDFISPGNILLRGDTLVFSDPFA